MKCLQHGRVIVIEFPKSHPIFVHADDSSPLESLDDLPEILPLGFVDWRAEKLDSNPRSSLASDQG